MQNLVVWAPLLGILGIIFAVMLFLYMKNKR